jgi:hypothetical protein
MSHIFNLIEELKSKILLLNSNDSDLIIYINRELQNLINRIDYNRELNHNEYDELHEREKIRKLFIQFYAFMLVNGHI